MDADDETIVVIVGEIEQKQNPKRTSRQFPVPFAVKDEPLDENELADLIETAKRYGQRLDVMDENNEEDGIKEELIINNNVMYEIVENVKIEHDIYDDNDEDYIPDQEEEDDEDKRDGSDDSDCEKDKRKRVRWSSVNSAQRKSFVQELRQEYPELRNNTKALVSTLSEIMRNVKRPLPPKDYFIINDILFECRKCGSMSETEQAAGRHYQEKHGKRYLVCFACGVDFRSTTNLYKHEKRCLAPDAVTVLKARAQCLGRKGRSRPFLPAPSECIVRQPVSKKHNCTLCSAQFSSKVHLDAHENMHKGLRPYRCDECPCAYTSETRLKRHLKKHSNIEYICDYCQRSFKVKETLVVHLNTHMPERKFPCEYCLRRYSTKHALTVHVRRLHLQLPHACACPICPMSYSRMSLVRDHMKKVHGMTLMTRKMFFKALPTLSDEQLRQGLEILKPNEAAFYYTENEEKD